MSKGLKTFDWHGRTALTDMKPELEKIAKNEAVSSVVVDPIHPAKGDNESGMALHGHDGRTGAYILQFRCHGASQHVKVFPRKGNDASGRSYEIALGAFLQTYYSHS
ncbi:MAG: hypothetical protein ABIA93_03255 [Candidatus Woesearchaeota archaeon]